MNELLTKGIGHTEFKDSPVGKIPKGWDVKRLGECVERFYQGINTVADKVVYERKGIPILQAKHITSGYISIGGAKFVSQVDFAIYKDKYNPRKGDVLLTNIGTIGKTVLVQEDKELLIAWNLFLISVNDKVQSKFLNYYLQRLDGLNFYENLMTGNATKFVNKTSLSEIEILSPPLPEQQKIASILTSVDEVIEKTQSQINKLQDMKKGTMNELLTKGIGHTEFKDSHVGKIPVEWDFVYISDVAKIGTGNKDTKDKEDNGIYPFFVRSQTVERINSYSYDGETILTAGDGVGTGKVFHYINGKFDFHQRVYKLSDFSSKISGRFLFEYFRLNFISQVNKYSAKGSVDSVRMEMISKMWIPLPTLEEQLKIAKSLLSIETTIEEKQRKLEQTQSLKKSLMQDLLTGKVRVTVN